MNAEVTATLAAERPRRPPMVELAIDLRAHNPSAEERWCLVPRDVEQAVGVGDGVDVLEVMAWTGESEPVTVGAFQGPGGFYAVLLAPGASVELRGLGVRWFRDDDDAPPPPLTAVTTATLTIDGRPAQTWFTSSPAVSGARKGERPEFTSVTRFHADAREVAVEVGAAIRHELPLR